MSTRKILIAVTLLAALLSGCRKAYDNPIANNSQQPDKVLFDKSVKDIEKHRYELARLTLQTLINTYPDSEYLAKAKLAIADSWYREGTSHALAQAEAEYQDFITFFPTMEEAAESQLKICDIHYEQMVKPDRDNTHALRADQECRKVLLQWPNSVFAEDTRQRLREVQEVLAEAEYRVGMFYTKKGSYRSGVNRLQTVSDHYPLFSNNDEALWTLGTTYEKMGEQYQPQSVTAYQRLVREYPLSPFTDDARARLSELGAEVPAVDEEARKIQEYNLANESRKGPMKKALTIFGTAPDVRMAAKTGEPAMTSMMPATPPGIRPSRGTSTTPSADVSVQPISGPSALDTEPDARSGQQQQPEQQNDQ